MSASLLIIGTNWLSVGVALKGLVEDGARWTSTQVQTARTGGNSVTKSGGLAPSNTTASYGSTLDGDNGAENAALVSIKSTDNDDDDGSDDSLVE